MEGFDLTCGQFVLLYAKTGQKSSKLCCALIICIVCLRCVLSPSLFGKFDQNGMRGKRRKFQSRFTINNWKANYQSALKAAFKNPAFFAGIVLALYFLSWVGGLMSDCLLRNNSHAVWPISHYSVFQMLIKIERKKIWRNRGHYCNQEIISDQKTYWFLNFGHPLKKRTRTRDMRATRDTTAQI